MEIPVHDETQFNSTGYNEMWLETESQRPKRWSLGQTPSPVKELMLKEKLVQDETQFNSTGSNAMWLRIESQRLKQ